jgi:ABC-type glutathione transport system ATPase component
VLEVKNLKIYTDDKYIVKNISFTLKAGEVLGILGPSGSGKTHIACAILGLIYDIPLEKMEGEIWFNGENLLKGVGALNSIAKNKRKYRKLFREYIARMKDIQGKGIALIPQETKSTLNPFHRIQRQVADAYQRNHQTDKTETKNIAESILSELGLIEQKNKFPHQLSGGECQRTSIAIALALDPLLMIADEPTTGLDCELQSVVENIFLKFMSESLPFQKKRGKRSLMIISHKLDIIEKLASKIIILHDGNILESDKTDVLLQGGAKEKYTQQMLKLFEVDKNLNDFRGGRLPYIEEL